jgi:hypothetical protein
VTIPGPHEPCEMRFSHRDNHKYKHHSAYGHITYKNHWYSVYVCPICGKTASHRRKPIICKGEVIT